MTRRVQVTLGECCEIISGATPDTGNPSFWGGSVCWATPKDLSDLDGAYISDTPRKLTQAGLDSCAASMLPSNSVLFSSRAPIGHVAINAVPMATNQGFKSFIPKDGLVHAKYLYHWLRRNRAALERLGNGATFKEVSKAIVSRVEITLPSIEEQRRIAHILDRADALRAKRRAALAQLDTLTQSIFLDMFGDPRSGSESFGLVPLKEVLARPLQNGAYFPKDAYCSEGGVEMVHMSDAFSGIVQRGNLKRVHCSQADIQKYALSRADLLVARRSLNYEGAAKPCMIGESAEPLIFESSLIRLTPSADIVDLVYMFHYLSDPQVCATYVAPFVTTSTISGINQGNLERVPVIVPPIELQRKFASRIRQIDSARTTQQGSLLALGALFDSLQHHAFSGEL